MIPTMVAWNENELKCIQSALREKIGKWYFDNDFTMQIKELHFICDTYLRISNLLELMEENN